MSKKIILITADLETGAVELRAEGYVGKACEKATAEFLRLLGQSDQSGKTPDYYRTETVKEKQPV